jgi:hypothetical protein
MSPPPLATSSITIQGNISKRTLIYTPQLPVFESSNIYSPSVDYVVLMLTDLFFLQS